MQLAEEMLPLCCMGIWGLPFMSKRERDFKWMQAYSAVEVVVSLDYYVIRHHVWVMFDGGLYSVLINMLPWQQWCEVYVDMWVSSVWDGRRCVRGDVWDGRRCVHGDVWDGGRCVHGDVRWREVCMCAWGCVRWMEVCMCAWGCVKERWKSF